MTSKEKSEQEKMRYGTALARTLHERPQASWAGKEGRKDIPPGWALVIILELLIFFWLLRSFLVQHDTRCIREKTSEKNRKRIVFERQQLQKFQMRENNNDAKEHSRVGVFLICY